MVADKTVRCDCGYEVRADNEAGYVDAVRRHAWEVHGIDFSLELALDVVRRTRSVPSIKPSEHKRLGEERR